MAVSFPIWTHADTILCTAWDPLGSRIAIGADCGHVRVFHTTTGAEIAQWKFKRAVNSVAWKSSGAQLAVGSFDGFARILDISSGEELESWAHEDSVASVAWDVSGSFLATGCADNCVRVFSIRDRSSSPYVSWKHSAWVWSVSWDPSSVRIASVSQDRTLQVFDMVNKKVSLEVVQSRAVNTVAWDFTGMKLATGSCGGDIIIYRMSFVNDIALAVPIAQWCHTDMVNSVCWNPINSWLAIGAGDGVTSICEWADGSEVARWELESGTNQVSWDAAGVRLAAGTDDGIAHVLDLGAKLKATNWPRCRVLWQAQQGKHAWNSIPPEILRKICSYLVLQSPVKDAAGRE